MSANHVYVFFKAQSKYPHVAEISAYAEMSYRPATSCTVRLLARKIYRADVSVQTVVHTLPSIREDITVIIVFMALGF